MKAQDMPMKTIVFVIIALIVIAVVVIWYLVASGTIKASTLDIFGIGEEKLIMQCGTSEDCPPGYECRDCTGYGYICVAFGHPCPD